MVAEGGKGGEGQLRLFTLEQLWASLAEGVTHVEGHPLILSVICLSSWSLGPRASPGSGSRSQRGPLVCMLCRSHAPSDKAPSLALHALLCVLPALLSLPLRPGTCLFGSPAWTSPSPAATVPSELETKVGGLHQPGYSSHSAVVTPDSGVAGRGWHPVLLGASGPASPSPGLRASPCSAQCAHPGFLLGAPPTVCCPFSPEVGRPSSPLPQLSLIFLSSPL